MSNTYIVIVRQLSACKLVKYANHGSSASVTFYHFFKKLPLFAYFRSCRTKKPIQFLQQVNMKNVHPVSCSWIQSHNHLDSHNHSTRAPALGICNLMASTF